MRLTIAPGLWHDLCRTAARYPTCTLHLFQHEGCVKRFTVEHGPEPAPLMPEEAYMGTSSDPETYHLDESQSA
jgi:hypothetical protein